MTESRERLRCRHYITASAAESEMNIDFCGVSFATQTHSLKAAIAVATWLSVCVSVTLMYCAQTTESIIVRSVLLAVVK